MHVNSLIDFNKTTYILKVKYLLKCFSGGDLKYCLQIKVKVHGKIFVYIFFKFGPN